MKHTILAAALALCTAAPAVAQQIQVSTEHYTASDFTDPDGDDHGRGSAMRYTARYVQPLSMHLDSLKRPTVWTLTTNAALTTMNNTGEADIMNPDKILNAGVTLAHIRPISPRWALIASAGLGMYANPSDVQWNSLLANAAAIFAYKVNQQLSLGAGAALTNSYGAPMIVPMAYVKYTTRGRYELEANIAGGIRLAAATRLNQHWRLTWTAAEFDGTTAVIRVGGENKIYTSQVLRSYLTPQYYITKKFSVYLDAGVNISRTCRITDRKIRYMFSLQSRDDRRHFRPAARLAAGLRYGL